MHANIESCKTTAIGAAQRIMIYTYTHQGLNNEEKKRKENQAWEMLIILI